MKFKNIRKVRDLNSDQPSAGECFAEYLEEMRNLTREGPDKCQYIPAWSWKSEAIQEWRKEFAGFLRENRIPLLRKDMSLNLYPIIFEDTYRGFTEGELKEAFDKVVNPNDWRGPILAHVELDKVEVTVAAIIFYTGTEVLKWAHPSGKVMHIESIGYRNGPCGP